MYKSVQALYGIKGAVKSALHQRVAAELTELGARMIEEASRTKTYKNRTGNLVESYGSCLYVDGKEWKGDFKYTYGESTLAATDRAHPSRRYYPAFGVGNTPRKNPIDGTEETGFEAIERFFDDYKAPKGKWQLVIAAGMFYGAAVEARGYKVISQIAMELYGSEEAMKYKGVVKDVPNRWTGV